MLVHSYGVSILDIFFRTLVCSSMLVLSSRLSTFIPTLEHLKTITFIFSTFVRVLVYS